MRRRPDSPPTSVLPEALYRAAFEAAPQPMWLADAASGALVDANRAALRQCGWTRAQLARKALDDLPGPGPGVAPELARRRVAVDGRELWIVVRAAPAAVAAGEARLRDLEARYRRVADQAGFGIWQITPDGRTVYANRAMADILELGGPEDLAGRHFREFATEEAMARFRVEHEKRRRRLGSTYEVELVGRRGARRRVIVSGAPLTGPGGELEGMVGAFFDVTGWRRAEDELAHQSRVLDVVIDSMSDGVVVADENGRFLLFNPAAEEIAGAGAIESSPERWQADYGIYRPDGVTPFPAGELPLARAIRGEAVDQVEMLVRNPSRPDGVRVSISGRPLRDETGRSRGGVVVFRDITEQRRLEDQMRRAQKMDAIGRLADGMAHDFGTITTAIRCYARALAAGTPTADARRKDADGILAACEHAMALSRRFLEFSRVKPVAPALLDLNEVVRGIDPLARPLLGRRIELAIEARAAHPAVRVDRAELEQVILNLVVNARDAMPEGGRLSIETGNVALDPAEAPKLGVAPGAYVRMVVADTGAGMEPEVQARIFEPYFTTKPKGQGTGLGLFSTYGILRRAGGHISVRTAPGRGATFTVLLPSAAGKLARPKKRKERRKGGGGGRTQT